MFKRFKFTGYADFGDKKITDQQVYEFVKANTRLIDRLNPKKMLALTLFGFSLLADPKATDEDACIKDYVYKDMRYHV